MSTGKGGRRNGAAAIRPVHANAIWRNDGLSAKVTGNLPRIPDDSLRDSPSARARRRHGGQFHGRDRSDHRFYGHAADRWPAWRLAALQLGVRGIPAVADG